MGGGCDANGFVGPVGTGGGFLPLPQRIQDGPRHSFGTYLYSDLRSSLGKDKVLEKNLKYEMGAPIVRM